MKKLYKKLFAFSLVELMISLITISCIAAAFTPVITKKLKKQDVALSIAQTSEITTKCHKGEEHPFGNDTDGYKCELCTKAYCINCGLTCPDTKYADPQSCTCKNCSENKTVVPDGCEACKKCITCTKDACTKCEAGYFLKGLDNKTYTTCQKCGKTNGRNNFCFDGINELSPEYCDSPPGGFFCKDDKLVACSTEYEQRCKTCDSSQCLSCIQGCFLNSLKKCQPCGISSCIECTNESHCTKCDMSILDSTNNKCVSCGSIFTNCSHCEGDTKSPQSQKCLRCKTGYYVGADGKSCKLCSDVANCIYCQQNTDNKCAVCKEGYYPNANGICEECSLAHCAKCKSQSTCEICEQGYYISNNVCVATDGNFNCSDSNFVQIGNLCVTRKNMGDSKTLVIPNTVKKINGGEYCYSSNTGTKCCWQDTTSTNCDDNNGGYSGCKRTVCNWYAAEEICEKFDFGGKKWRLPKAREMSNWINYSTTLGKNGLMLCDEIADVGETTTYCGRSNLCQGAISGTCIINYVWSEALTDTVGDLYMMQSGNWFHHGIEYYHDKKYAFSTRCVTEME